MAPKERLSNLDCTRMRVVRRGCLIEFPGGATARVKLVRMGNLVTHASFGHYSNTRCNDVRVIDDGKTKRKDGV